MSNESRLHYLEALGISTWVPRTGRLAGALSSAPEPVAAGTGTGSILCVCNAEAETLLPIAADLSRALREPAVWAWPQPGGENLAGMIAERLCTCLVVFGSELAGRVLADSRQPSIGSARLVVVAALPELARSARARKSCWQALLQARATA